MSIPFTGERPIPGAVPDSDFWGVIARYLLARQILKDFSVSRVLDVGCGTGVGSGFLARQGFSVTGLDVDSESIEWGKVQEFDRKLVLMEGRGENLPYDNGAFDAIIAFECIEHMDSPYAFVSEANRVLRPDGMLLCSVPYCIGDVLAELLHGTSNPYHIQRFTPQTISYLLSRHFAIGNWWGQEFNSIGHYAYVFANFLTWQYLRRIPLVGNACLKWRGYRNMCISSAKNRADHNWQMNYEFWDEDSLPTRSHVMRFSPETKAIPETLIFLANKK